MSGGCGGIGEVNCESKGRMKTREERGSHPRRRKRGLNTQDPVTWPLVGGHVDNDYYVVLVRASGRRWASSRCCIRHGLIRSHAASP
jgi:hypothetical protein